MLGKKKTKEYDILVFHNRFGRIITSLQHKIHFPKGLIGISESKTFCLASAPGDKLKSFKLLQSIESEQLCFLTLPIVFNNNIIKNEDLQKVANNLGLEMKNTAIILICSTKKVSDKIKVVVNARAPIFIDVLNKVACQYVLYNSDYSLTHIL